MSIVLSEHLPLLATAPDGIQKLRGLILELAVRGKLVPQDTNDEPATELLKQIAKERAKLEAEGTYKKSKATLISAEEPPFNAPDGWAWVCLTQLGEFRGGKTPSTNRSEYWDGSIPWVSPKDMKSLVVSQTEDYVTDLAISDGLQVIPASSVLTVVRSGILRRTVPVAINSVKCTVNQDLKALCLVLPGMAQYVQLLIRGFERQILKTLTKVGTTVESIKFEEFSQHPFPLPPLAEQYRIVAKIDELMALCDRLEAEQADAESVQAKLVESLLGTLTQHSDATDFARNWQRIAEHFNILCTTESSLEILRQTVLQLAVMGKLVPQSRDDEPASELLKQITQERARLEATGACKKAKPMPPVRENHKLFTLPAGWEWARLGDLSEVITSGSRDWAQHYSADGAIFVRMGNLSRGSYQLRLNNIQRVAPPSDGEGTRTRLQPGDLLLSITGEVGLLGLIPEGFGEAYINQHTCMIRTFSIMRGRFIPEVLRSPLALVQYNEPQRGIKNSFRLTDVAELIVPLPPLAEQNRIVAKIDELMTLCDRLNADLAESRNQQAQLASALIETALKAA